MNTTEDPREQPTGDPAPEETVPEQTVPEETVPAPPSDPGTGPAAAEAGPDAAGPRETTAVFTRRRGAPTLTSWILLSLAVPAIGALVLAPLFGVSGLTALLTVTLAAVLAIGFPLAGLVGVVDAIIHRRRRQG